jgi:hypothetical protein
LYAQTENAGDNRRTSNASQHKDLKNSQKNSGDGTKTEHYRGVGRHDPHAFIWDNDVGTARLCRK